MTGWKRDVALAFVFLHFLALLAYTLRWLWIAILAIALLINAAKSEELIPPTAEEAEQIKAWIPAICCRTNNCCMKVHESALIALPNNQIRVRSTGQVLGRTGWSQDKNTWRCTCDWNPATSHWDVHPGATTRCVFDHMQGY